MFDFLPEVCREINENIKDIYWLLIAPYTTFIIVSEFFKLPKGNPEAGDVVKRAAVSILLLITFDYCLEVITFLSDGITQKIGGFKSLSSLLEYMVKSYKESEVSWMDIREAIIYIMGLMSYVVAYLGVFVAKVLISFVWAILYICSPLMILAYVSPKTAFVTSSLYKGLIGVAIWKVLWSILGILLLKMITSPEAIGSDNFLITIILNFCVGVSMLFIPLTTKSLLSDGMASAAGGMAAAPTLAASQAIKTAIRLQGKKIALQGASLPRAAIRKAKHWKQQGGNNRPMG